MKKIYNLIMAVGLLWSAGSVAGEIENNKPSFTRLDKIVVIVNREPITLSELRKEMERTQKRLEQIGQPPPTQAELRKQAMDDLIAKSLQKQLCQARNIRVTTDEVNKIIENIAKSNKLSLAQLKEAVQQSGIGYEEYKAQIGEQALLQKLQQEEVARSVALAPEDVKKFVQENRDKFNRYTTFHVIDILLPANQAQVLQIGKQANELARRLQTSKDPEATLKCYANVEKNDLGWRSLAEIPSLFQSKIAVMNLKEISMPVQAPNGFHILELVEAKGQAVVPTETQIKGMAFQQKMVEAVKDWVQKLRKDAYIKVMN